VTFYERVGLMQQQRIKKLSFKRKNMGDGSYNSTKLQLNNDNLMEMGYAWMVNHIYEHQGVMSSFEMIECTKKYNHKQKQKYVMII
jgi:hypothetical protein